jgi:hypothetical protein
MTTVTVKCVNLFHVVSITIRNKIKYFYLNSLVALKRAFLLLLESTNKQI